MGVLILVFLVIDAIVITFWIMESNKLKQCKVTQSIFCPTISCNSDVATGGGPDTIEHGMNCFPYAYRLDENDKTVCNLPNTRGDSQGTSPT